MAVGYIPRAKGTHWSGSEKLKGREHIHPQYYLFHGCRLPSTEGGPLSHTNSWNGEHYNIQKAIQQKTGQLVPLPGFCNYGKQHRSHAKQRLSVPHTDCKLMAVTVAEALEDEDEELVEHLQDLVVVLVDLHLQVKTRELGKVPVRVRVLGTEHYQTGFFDIGYWQFCKYLIERT